jgi:hypothetical protein
VAKKRRIDFNAQLLKVRFVLNGKDWDDCTEEERDQFRAHATRIALDVSLRPIEERYGKALVAVALRAVLNLWEEERAGHAPPFLIPLMERSVPSFVLARVVEAILATPETKLEKKPPEPQRYVI